MAMRVFLVVCVALLALAAEARHASAAPIEERDIIAFTPEPNDLGPAATFFRLYPRTRCVQESIDTDKFLYFCEADGRIQRFYFNLAYDDNTLVLSGASLAGENPNLDGTLRALQKQLVPHLFAASDGQPRGEVTPEHQIAVRLETAIYAVKVPSSQDLRILRHWSREIADWQDSKSYVISYLWFLDKNCRNVTIPPELLAYYSPGSGGHSGMFEAVLTRLHLQFRAGISAQTCTRMATNLQTELSLLQ